MEIIDQIFSKIYTLLDRAVDFLKHLTRLEIMVKLNEMSRKIHSSLIVLSIIFLNIRKEYLLTHLSCWNNRNDICNIYIYIYIYI